jgi:VanZ family protein
MTQARAVARFSSFEVWPAVAYTAAILVVGSLPSSPSAVPQVSDKTLHFIGFGVLAWLAQRAVRYLRPQAPLLLICVWGFALSGALGGLLELWQALLPYRTCEFLDWVADVLGAGLAAVLRLALHLGSKHHSSNA